MFKPFDSVNRWWMSSFSLPMSVIIPQRILKDASGCLYCSLWSYVTAKEKSLAALLPARKENINANGWRQGHRFAIFSTLSNETWPVPTEFCLEHDSNTPINKDRLPHEPLPSGLKMRGCICICNNDNFNNDNFNVLYPAPTEDSTAAHWRYIITPEGKALSMLPLGASRDHLGPYNPRVQVPICTAGWTECNVD